MQSEYAQEFTVFKPDKRLEWLPHLGTVQLDIELEDRKLEVDVPSLEAVFIELFSQKHYFLFTLFLDVLDIVDWPIFLSYLGSRRPY
jgi:anaphase-promoting complex subunit 2